MATRGTEFIGSELLKQVAGNYDRRIAELAEEINGFNALTLTERHATWRATAERRVKELAARLSRGDEVTDAELSGFDIKSPPRPDDYQYAIQARENQIESLERAKGKALAYILSLAADQGVVTLGAADLRRIGYGL